MRNYLATTGISDIWDRDSKILLLGPWCQLGEKNKKVLISKEYTLLSSPWKPAKTIKTAADYTHTLYENLLPQISQSLNLIHNVSCPVKYWQILLGPWLLHFIGILYDRFRRVEEAKKKYPDLFTHVLSKKKCILKIFNTYDFLNKAKDDYFNLLLFSLAAYELCPNNIIEIEYDGEQKFETLKHSRKRKLFDRLVKPFQSSSNSLIVLSDMYHLSLIDKLKIKLKLGFDNIYFTDFIDIKFFEEDFASKKNYSHMVRESIKLSISHDRFCTFLGSVLPYAIPRCYIENYRAYRDKVLTCYSKRSVQCIGSAVGWYFNEGLKFFAAESVLHDAKLVDFQHGGVYGTSLAAPTETISLEKDTVYTWGWFKKRQNNIVTLPSPHLSKLKDKHSDSTGNLIFVGTGTEKYHYRFETLLSPDDVDGYFGDKKIFFGALDTDIMDNILYRPLKEFGWEEKNFIGKVCPKVKYIEKGSLCSWMQKGKIVVIDHPQTSFIEALIINVPCIFYWNHDLYLMRSEAEKYFQILRDAGILYKDPFRAAKKINEIFDDPLGWWHESNLQAARNMFCEHYALSSDNWLPLWVKELNTI